MRHAKRQVDNTCAKYSLSLEVDIPFRVTCGYKADISRALLTILLLMGNSKVPER